MKKGDEIKIYREQNGFVVRVFDITRREPALVFVYNKQENLLADLEEIISDAQCEIDDQKVKETKEVTRRLMHPDEE